eukprot:231324_1
MIIYKNKLFYFPTLVDMASEFEPERVKQNSFDDVEEVKTTDVSTHIINDTMDEKTNGEFIITTQLPSIDGISPSETIIKKTDPKVGSDGVSAFNYFIGIGYILAAGLSLAFQITWVKFGKLQGYKPFQMLLGRGIIQFYFTGMIDVHDTYCVTQKHESPHKETHHPNNLAPQNSKEWMYVSIRGVLGFLTAYTNFTAVTYLPLSDSMTIFATFPIWTIIFAAIFLKEQIRNYHVIALILGICGVMLVAQPTFIFPDPDAEPPKDYTRGLCYCLFGSFVNSGAFLVLRKLKNIKATYSVYSYAVGCIVGSLFTGATKWSEWKAIDFSTWYDPTLLFTLGFFGFAGQYLKTKSIQYIPAGVASLVRSTDVLFGMVLQRIFFKRVPNKLKCVGGLMVALPIMIVSYFKIQKAKELKQKELQKV